MDHTVLTQQVQKKTHNTFNEGVLQSSCLYKICTGLHNFALFDTRIMYFIIHFQVRLTYTLEGDNVLKQVIIPKGGGRVAHFRREFGENGAKMVTVL